MHDFRFRLNWEKEETVASLSMPSAWPEVSLCGACHGRQPQSSPTLDVRRLRGIVFQTENTGRERRSRRARSRSLRGRRKQFPRWFAAAL